MSHFISLEQAVIMTSTYRIERENILKSEYSTDILPICETFDKADFQTLLDHQDCEKIRVYFSMVQELNIKVVVVGVNNQDEDILPANEENLIMENGTRCPAQCPPSSVLNTDE